MIINKDIVWQLPYEFTRKSPFSKISVLLIVANFFRNPLKLAQGRCLGKKCNIKGG
jgi:hypothetical protein